MPPVGGLGGNAALHDAQLLCRALTTVHRGESSLLPALHSYEAQMLKEGFGSVREALLYTRLAIMRSHVVRTVARAFFRFCGAVPPVRRAIFEND
jgi:2-polyprenyl-6-methoxyphenol hydroxylase-like FAD-dependent oxidoreductase